MSDTSSDEEDMIFTLALLSEAEENEKYTTKRQWVHSIHLAREKEGEFYTLFPHLKQDNKKFFQYFRMSYEKFCQLLEHIKPDIQKRNTNFRKCIPADERLAVTLRSVFD